MREFQRNLRKAALLIASLDDRNAAALLAQMSPAQSRAVHDEMQRLGAIDPAEQRGVIEEFFRVGPLVPDKQPAGIEIDDRLPSHLALSPPSDLVGGSTASAKRPFRFLHETPVQTLIGFLEREHPQVVAVVVSHLPAERAADILGGLSPPVQLEVARRLVDLDDANPDVLSEVERGLESWICQQLQGQRRRSAGLAALDDILEAASPSAKRHILTNLARHDRQLAARLKAPLAEELAFANLEQLDAASLGVVARQAPRELLVLALAGASVEFAVRVCELLEVEMGGSLAQALRQLGPTRLSDVEEAQNQLCELAAQLALRGEIALPACHRGHLSVAV
jgi:flagellar motor switch protein FliG